jgi:hypothetical protein
MSIKKKILISLFCTVTFASAQQSSYSKEFWPEIDVWLRVSPSWRFSVYVPLSTNMETKYREGSLVLQADYAWGKPKRFLGNRLFDENKAQILKSSMIRCGYLSGISLSDSGDTYSENTAFTEYHLRTPYKGKILVNHRFRCDLRWLGDDNEFSYRLRYRFMVEKELHAKNVSFVPYFNVEPYYDSRYATINRVRIIGGASMSWSPRYALEGNFTYQHDTRSSVENLCALNVILHLYFETGKGKAKRF